jgi:hypothetical protein
MSGFTAITTADVTLASVKTVLSMIGAATVRLSCNTIVIGPGNITPADNTAVYQLRRFTADGTGTAVTPQPNDPPSAPLGTAKYNYTVEPTNTAGAILLQIGLNMRANYQWYANISREKIVPATSGNGFGLHCFLANTPYPVTATLEWSE